MPLVTCSVPGCKSNSSSDEQVKFHRIGKPNDRARTKAWTIAIKRYDLLAKPTKMMSKYICSLHFEKCMYALRNLKKSAIPTLNLPSDCESASKALTTSKIGDFSKTMYANKKDNEVEAEETALGATEVVIKHEPPESSEMTIEQEQIGYFEILKSHSVLNSGMEKYDNLLIPKVESMDVLKSHSVLNSGMAKYDNLLIPKVESMDVDDQIGNESTMDETYKYYKGEATANPIKEEHFVERVDSYVEKKPITKNIKINLPKPSKRKLKKIMQYTKKKININKNKKKQACRRFLLGCDIYLTPLLSSIVKTKLNSKGDEFTDEYKMFCLNLYLSSPTTYKFLSQILCLPSKNDLIKSYFSVNSKINKEVLSILTVVANKMSFLDKECVLTLGEIKLKKSIFYDAKADRVFGLHEINGQQLSRPGCYAYTVMLRGITTDWKLLIGFSLALRNKMNIGFNHWLESTLAQLFQIGFKVRAVCCPLLPVSSQLLDKKDLLENKFYLEIDGKKVYFIFDIRRIIIKARNALRAHTVVMKDIKASWTCIQELYEVDHKKVNRLAPILTKVHVKPKKHHLNKLRYASDVFDNSIAVALHVYTKKKHLNPSLGTNHFMDTMSKVFKALNSDKPITCSNEEKQLFAEARALLKSFLVKNKDYQISFSDALSITLNSISQMGDEIQSENIIISRPKLTHSCMKPFYDAMRQLSGHSRRVTCREYLRAFRICFLFYAMRMAEKKDTSLTNNAAFLGEYEDYVRTNKIYQKTKRELSEDIMLPVYLYTSAEDNTFISACSYMLMKCVEKHACPKLIDYVSSSVAALNPEVSDTAGLYVPPEHFLIYCRNLENYLQYTFNHFVGENIFKNIKQRVKRRLYFDKPCNCFPVDFLLDMFIKVKFNNMAHSNKFQYFTSSFNECYS